MMARMVATSIACMFLWPNAGICEEQRLSLQGVSLGMPVVDAIRASGLPCRADNDLMECTEDEENPSSDTLIMYLDNSGARTVASVSFRFCATQSIDVVTNYFESKFFFKGTAVDSDDFDNALVFQPSLNTEVTVKRNSPCQGPVQSDKPRMDTSYTVFFSPIKNSK